jgi:hypothetical protein
MPEFCTCGTQLVEGARFCHKCGKPTSDEPEIRIETPRIILTPPVLAPMAAPVTFANPVALRMAFAAATLSILLDSIPLLNLLFIIWAMGAGFMAVWMYRRRTGLPLSVGNGAKLGWITGVFSFVISTILTTMTVVLGGQKLADDYRNQMKEFWPKDPQLLSAFQDPAAFATIIIFALVFLFVLLSIASVAGGALGARFSNKQ